MRHVSLSLLALALMGCPKNGAVNAGDVAPPAPEPLEARPFNVPQTQEFTLSNGIPVVLLENHEVPLFSIQLVLGVGSYLDPEGQEGLASATFDMLNEGAGEMDAAEISRKLRLMGSSVGAGAGLDGSAISASGVVRNLDATLDIWSAVLRAPSFPAEDWEIMQRRKVANIEASRKDPNSVAGRVLYRLFYGDAYAGRSSSVESVSSIDTAGMRAFYEGYVGPAQATILVGGALTKEDVLPALEKAVGDWKVDVEEGDLTVSVPAIESATMYFIDEPGAAQSVIQTAQTVGNRTDDDYFPFAMASRALGGSFVARVNMNLREDKGYTYGARCSAGYRHGPGMWSCSTSVRTDATGPSLVEIKKEIDEALDARPLTEDEIGAAKSSVTNSYPRQFETTGSLLGQQVTIQRYGLNPDWVASYVPNVRGVTADAANAAFQDRITPDQTIWLVVGDKETIFDDVVALGLPVVELDREGNPLE
jgi:zinc protease